MRTPSIYSLAAAKSSQLCPTLCDPIEGSPPGSPVPGILQARTLEWVAISFSNAWKWKVKSESEVAQLCPTLATPWTAAYQAPPSMGFSRQEYWSGEPLPSPIYSLNNFQIHHAAVLTSCRVMHHVSSTYLSHSWELVPFGHLHSVPHPPLCVSSDLFS